MGSKSSISYKNRVANFHSQQPFLQWIAGKWFLAGNELKDARRWFYQNSDARDEKDVERLMDNFIIGYGDYEGKWPVLSIVERAKAKLAKGDKPTELVLPLTDKELKILNYLLVGDAGYAVFFYGVGGSGKSTICDLYCQIFGSNNCCYKKLVDIEKFNIELASARLWFDDDLSPYWSDTRSARFKAIITNGPASFEAKGKTPWMGRYRCKFIGACNVPIKFDLSDSGMLRRIVYYSKNSKISNPDSSLQGKQYTEEELVNVVMAALSIDMTNWTDDFKEETREVIKNSNSVWKYGMIGNYEDYVMRTEAAGYSAFGQDKWIELRALFEEWGDSNESARTLF